MLVVIFHAGYEWLEGGFIGVDIFFVISGFLITRNITKELNQNRWHFYEFYLKRAARLFPALFTTVALTLLASFYVLNPDDLARLGRTSLLTILSSSNIFFFLESGYFDVSAEFKPLLHTWSLAVEEQFYMVWPLLLFFFYKISKQKAIVAGLIVVGIMSFAAAIWMSQFNPTAVFFLTPFRGYQFALGGLIGLIGVSKNSKTASFAGGISVVTIIVLATMVEGQSHHFYAAAIPALLTTVIIWASQSTVINWIFGTMPMIWIGQRSYSIYLAHWPIIVLWKLKTDYSFSPLESFLSVIISIFAGAILHKLVEKPFRFRPGLSIRRRSSIIAGCTALGIAVIVSGAHFWGMSGFPGRIPPQFAKLSEGIGEQWVLRQKELRTGTCNLLTFKASAIQHSVDDFDLQKCGRASPDKPSYLVVGDSFAGDAYLVLKDAYPNVFFGQVTVPGCQLRKPEQIDGKLFPVCKELYSIALNKLAKESGFDGIVLASNWLDGHYYRIDELIKMMPNVDFKIIVVGQHIRFQERLPTIILSAMSEVDATKKAQSVLKAEPGKINDIIKERFQGRITFLDFMKLQCPNECDVFTPEHGLMYLDDSHVSFAGAKLLAERLGRTRPGLFD
jgi:peptidoglycan/LPS O-acetylase OafA/YrhL